MNILRMIYRNNQMGEFVQPYIAEGVKIAITGFKSPVWGVNLSISQVLIYCVTVFLGTQFRYITICRSGNKDIWCAKNKGF